MTEKEFGIVFAKLALQLRWTDSDVATIKSYFEVLRELPLEAVRMAAERFSREAGRKFPPNSAEWFQAARSAESEVARKVLALPSGREEPWHHECLSCEDTGWVMHLECDGGSSCGRTRRHAAHSYTKPCGCRANNHTYQRTRVHSAAA